MWLLLLGSSPVEFVVKCEQGEYGPVFVHGLTLAHFEADGCLNSSAKTGLLCFFVVEK